MNFKENFPITPDKPITEKTDNTSDNQNEAELLEELANSKSRQAEFISNKLNSKFEQELARLEAIQLTGDIVKDARQVAEAQGSIAPDMAEALEQGDRDKLKEIIKEWNNGIDSYLAGAGATDKKVAPSLDNPAQQAMLNKKRELLNTILESSK